MNNRKVYHSDRNKRNVSFVTDDIEIKNLIKEAAKADGRGVSNWMRSYVQPMIEELAKSQLKAKSTVASCDAGL